MAKNLYPVAYLQLDESDKEFLKKDPKGREAKFKIEQLDGDSFYFPTQEDTELFLVIHGMEPVSDDAMGRLRKELEG